MKTPRFTKVNRARPRACSTLLISGSAGLISRMRALAATGVLWMTVCSVHAGFETGNGVALTGGVVRVNYMENKSRTISLGPKLRVELMEVQVTFANGKIKKHTMFFSGQHALRVPLPIELAEILGPLLLLVLVCGIIIVLGSALRFRRAEPGGPPNGGPAARLAKLEATEGPHR
jgi:hypothetical protein